MPVSEPQMSKITDSWPILFHLYEEDALLLLLLFTALLAHLSSIKLIKLLILIFTD